jgi:hypothetical protein
MSLDERQLLGCVYVFPTHMAGFDAEVTMWVRQSELASGLDEFLWQTVRSWVEREWPFQHVGYPGYPGWEISWAEWEALPLKGCQREWL